MDFDYIVLTKKEFKRLRELSRHPVGLPTGPNESALMDNRLIVRNRYGSNSPDAACPPTTISVITQEGKNYLLYRDTQKNERRKDTFRFVLSTVIAFVALVIAIAALLIDLWQLGLL